VGNPLPGCILKITLIKEHGRRTNQCLKIGGGGELLEEKIGKHLPVF